MALDLKHISFVEVNMPISAMKIFHICPIYDGNLLSGKY